MGSVSIVLTLLLGGCAELRKPKVEPFYGGAVVAPVRKEFRWSNGKLPRHLDPARVSLPSENDLVRAIYEGLTELDSKTLKAMPAAAESWSATEDNRVWTFQLRQNAVWSNGKPVTAADFERSWKRLVEPGKDIPNAKLLKNIVGAEKFLSDDVIQILPDEEFENAEKDAPGDGDDPFGRSTDNLSKNRPASDTARNAESSPASAAIPVNDENPDSSDRDTVDPKAVALPSPAAKRARNTKWMGAQAIGVRTLKVTLLQPDKDFPALVAHPIFRPVFDDKTDLINIENFNDVVTNGAFRISRIDSEEIILERSESYWDAQNISLGQVRMIAKKDAESALAAYRANEIDALTNTHFEPLALKLLKPYEDFRREAHAALTFYQFNPRSRPVSDRRVREALAISLDRDRLTKDAMDDSAVPAFDFLPFTEEAQNVFMPNMGRARMLLEEAGFSAENPVPTLRLLVNRNDLQIRLSREAKKMWRQNLGIEVEIVVKGREEFEEAIRRGDFDLVRRGEVLASASETAGMMALFEPLRIEQKLPVVTADPESLSDDAPEAKNEEKQPVENVSTNAERLNEAAIEPANTVDRKAVVLTNVVEDAAPLVLTREQAVQQLPGIPLYFPVSYALIKPYVQGFEANALDAPNLKTVRLDEAWKPGPAK